MQSDYLNHQENTQGKVYHERADATLKVSEQDIIQARYNWGIEVLKRRNARTVLDVGCGLGFGTNVLAAAGFDTMGVDKSQDAIHVCMRRYPHINFTMGTIFDSFGKAFDAIIAFEVIEHMSTSEQAAFLSGCLNLLTNDGILLVTTPNITYSKMKNPHHKKEFHVSELRELFKAAPVKGVGLPHIRKCLSFFITRQRLENMHLPIFRVPLPLAEHVFIEISKPVLKATTERLK